MKLHKSEDRGNRDYSWLRANYSFSFGNYFNSERLGHGKLVVFNDDIIEPAGGFDLHSHKNMEIVTIPLSGELKHCDSRGNEEVLKYGDVQVMSAGSGIYHSEYNNSSVEQANILQSWIIPKKMDSSPKYDFKKFSFEDRTLLVSPDGRDGSLTIGQEAFYTLLATSDSYKLYNRDNVVFLFNISGLVSFQGYQIEKRDSIELSNYKQLDLVLENNSKLLIIEVSNGIF